MHSSRPQREQGHPCHTPHVQLSSQRSVLCFLSPAIFSENVGKGITRNVLSDLWGQWSSTSAPAQSSSTELRTAAQSSMPSFLFFLSDNCSFFPTDGTDPEQLQFWSQELTFFLRSILSLSPQHYTKTQPTTQQGKQPAEGCGYTSNGATAVCWCCLKEGSSPAADIHRAHMRGLQLYSFRFLFV